MSPSIAAFFPKDFILSIAKRFFYRHRPLRLQSFTLRLNLIFQQRKNKNNVKLIMYMSTYKANGFRFVKSNEKFEHFSTIKDKFNQ